ncbi:hypothetical protein MUK70_11945 [Dyadobacter chenwenxiniae]|uniref:Uncharacterized protein n=1 Tax=Dyadobacter chenwenxiniae TaxID=2906456 RepID=A0A9X1PHG2_9BACT|nr:hypothetical protein [Dyadobacter chenwenxiniae]MCF0059954.1 hypothetical protein [Dyadobacter chenwenxiniae]UON85693.1 hypothetical protein MUK70_11945 [Dyadobacter chenwenxiniae]
MDYKTLLEKFVSMVREEGDAYYVIKNHMRSSPYIDEDGEIYEGQHIFSEEEIKEIIRIMGVDPRDAD